MPLLLFAGAAALGAFGYAADKTGEGVNDAGTGLVKIAAAAGVGYFIAKKLKVI
jgi:hypothetical protein